VNATLFAGIMAVKSKYIFPGWKPWFKWALPVLLIAAIQAASFSPHWIETEYSTHWFVAIAKILRGITGWIPFSVGDILYALAGLLIMIALYKVVTAVLKRNVTWKGRAAFFVQLVRALLWVYIWFNIAWGLNYERLGIAYQLQLKEETYTTEDVCELRDSLAQKVNNVRLAISKDSALPELPLQKIYTEAIGNYNHIAKQYPFLQYQYPSVKNSLYTAWAPYFGWGGYYNPFSGEAQIRNDMPRVIIPYTSSHEIAHQLGYASESEANFVGYLAAANSADKYFQYSCYLDLYKYAFIELLQRNTFPDSDIKLDSLVKVDLRGISRFFMKERNGIAPRIMNLYDGYLKANQQKNGIESYNEVIGLLIAYQKKYGKI